MVTTVTADDCDVTHPLYGYKTDLKSRLPDRVPGWAFVPWARRGDEFGKSDTEEYLQAAIDHYTSATVDADERYKNPIIAHEYGVKGEMPGALTVSFTADPDATHMTRGGQQYHMPADIRDRLDTIKRSSTFDRKFDGYNVKFKGWEFTVTVGPRGGIQDVDLYAWGKR